MKVYHGYRKPNGTCILEVRDDSFTLISTHAGFDWLGPTAVQLTLILLDDATGNPKLAENYKHEFVKLVSALNPIEWDWSQKSILLELKDIIHLKQQGAKQLYIKSYVSPTVVQQKYEQILYKAGYKCLKDPSIIDKDGLINKWESKYHVFIKHISERGTAIALIKQKGDSKVYLSNETIRDISEHGGWTAIESIPALETALTNRG